MTTTREIKFRAWHPDKEQMIYNGVVIHDGKAYLDAREFEDGIQTNNAMQFTGLQDKNGKEIYEGDICVLDPAPKMSMQVEYREGGYKLSHRVVGIEDINDLSGATGLGIEIIGNIYENPELLK